MRGLRQLLGKAAAQEPAAGGTLRVLMVCMGNIATTGR
jgi:hypothetical protein